jgi:hypothetical protein
MTRQTRVPRDVTLVLMTTAAETYEALDTFIRTHGGRPAEWISGAE